MATVNINSKKFEAPKGGVYKAALVQIVDIGTQRKEFKGIAKNLRQMVFFYELLDVSNSEGKPFVLTAWYTLSDDPRSTMSKHLSTWSGDTFKGPLNTDDWIGRVCQLVVIEDKEKGRAYINSVLPCEEMAGQKPTTKTEQYYFLLDDYNPETFEKLGDFWKGLISNTPEFREKVLGADEADDYEDMDVNQGGY